MDVQTSSPPAPLGVSPGPPPSLPHGPALPGTDALSVSLIAGWGHALLTPGTPVQEEVQPSPAMATWYPFKRMARVAGLTRDRISPHTLDHTRIPPPAA